jgi:hypothetical protein
MQSPGGSIDVVIICLEQRVVGNCALSFAGLKVANFVLKGCTHAR